METQVGCHDDKVRFSPVESNGFHSVELRIDGMETPYQFRLWNDEQAPIFFIVKKNSMLLSRLEIGSTIPIKYYSSANRKSPVQQHPTRIVDIVADENGRFRGHCRVELAIVGPAAANTY